MIQLGCRLALMDETALPAWLIAHPERIAETFRLHSGGDIALRIDSSRLAKPRKTGNAGVEAYDLHRATGKIAANPRAPADNIAVLFASRYAHTRYGSVLGIMFDRGFSTDDDPSGSEDFMKIPREGCAVFLDAIRRLRTSDDSFERESFFTTVHELGHVFNLQHYSGSSFMASSPLAAPFELDHHVFTDDQSSALARCSTSNDVRPGGSSFDDRSARGHHDAVPPRTSAARFGLNLSISLASHRFFAFEPIELDIELRVLPGIQRSFTVPDQVDPGYERFVLWIEDPAGERRRYRSPRRYCAARATRVITPARPYCRDISVFGQAGGYTFAAPGIYRLWAEFTVGNAATLRSNNIELLVEIAPTTGLAAAAKELLGRRDVSRLLYHRLVRAAPRAIGTLARFCSNASHWGGIARVEYALGRALIHTASESSNMAPERAAAMGRRGARLLERAEDRQGLGCNQRRHIARLLRS